MASASNVALGCVLICGLLLAGCASNSEPPIQSAADSTHQRYEQNTAVTVIGTPFYALFKATGCILTVAIAAPGAALLEMTNRRDKWEERSQLDAGVEQNCGGSYVLGRS